MGKNWLEVTNRKIQKKKLMEINGYTKKYGLILSEQDAEIIIYEKEKTLQIVRRIEFGESILSQIIYAFCDSSYIQKDKYLDTLLRLQEIFFCYKNEMNDRMSDDYLIYYRRPLFYEVCFGDLDYLENTCLEIIAESVRKGEKIFIDPEKKGNFSKVDIVRRWDKDLF